MVLGIDPGLASCGWAILADPQTLSLCGCILTKKEDNLSSRLDQIYQEIFSLCQKYKIDELAVESVFFAKNSKTALLIAEVIGVVRVAACRAGARVFEYTPLQIKIAITGYGRAQKEQVIALVGQSLGESKQLTNNHTADAAAAAMTHFFTMKNLYD
jgi:crossover junction endodeoxyribonuclease RuvC